MLWFWPNLFLILFLLTYFAILFVYSTSHHLTLLTFFTFPIITYIFISWLFIIILVILNNLSFWRFLPLIWLLLRFSMSIFISNWSLYWSHNFIPWNTQSSRGFEFILERGVELSFSLHRSLSIILITVFVSYHILIELDIL